MSYTRLSKLASKLGEQISYGAFFRHFHPDHVVKEQKPPFIPANKEQWGWADTSGSPVEGSMKSIDELRG